MAFSVINSDYAPTWAYYAANETAAPPTACTAGSAVDQAGQLRSKSVHGLAAHTFVYDIAGRPLDLLLRRRRTPHE
jgi:hypothetical protein